MIHPLVCAAAALLLLSPAARAQEAFSFVALGDMPYGKREAVYPKFEALIGSINETAPEITLHVGDIKSGSTRCTDEEFANQRNFMNMIRGAVVYTPGDNEWTDCHRKSNGSFDPIERLAKLRDMFFKGATSLGAAPMTVERQADVNPTFATYVENARFVKSRVLFVTAHIVGSNNNFQVRDRRAVEEFMARDTANVAWIESSFAKAREMNARAVVFAVHADIWNQARGETVYPGHSGFKASIGETFVPLAKDFGRPVLFIHGDSHVFRIDRPFRDADGKPVENVTRLEVFGARQMHAVRVTVDPASRDTFAFRPIYNPMDK